MPELRWGALTGRPVVIAEGRSARPNEHAVVATRPVHESTCPFCEGNEGRTPPEVGAVRNPGTVENGPGWTVRAVPNRFPTVEVGGPVRASDPRLGLDRGAAYGLHEVIIESPHHSPSLPDMSDDQLRTVFRFHHERVRAHAERSPANSVLLFENWGPRSGGTLWHPHAQVISTALSLPRLAEEANGFAGHAAASPGRCLLEAVLAEEVDAAERVVGRYDGFDVIAPFGSEHPYETWIVPRRHAATFAEASPAEVDELAVLLPLVLRSLGRIVPDLSYNWWVHGLGPGPTGGGPFHWHVEVAPRLASPDGFDLGGGMPVNPVAPETAATSLREAFALEGGASPRKR